MKLLGHSDASYTPCIGLVILPYVRSDSDICFFWTAPPATNELAAATEYGRPMRMLHASVIDPCLSQEALDEIECVIAFSKRHSDFTDLTEKLNGEMIITRIGWSLLPKFPRDQDDRLWRYIRRELLGAEKAAALSDPLVSGAAFGGSPSTGHATNGVQADDEEEIDDDEDNALRKRRGSRVLSVQSACSGNSASSHQLPTTEEVISMLLQRQAPVAPAAHGASALPRRTSTDNGDEAPLDFSSNSKNAD